MSTIQSLKREESSDQQSDNEVFERSSQNPHLIQKKTCLNVIHMFRGGLLGIK
jgi:hypothetical protein